MYSIYKIINYDDNRVYYGHTKQPINMRFGSHKYKAKKGISRCSTKDFNFDNAEILCCEEIETETYDDVRKLERYYIENNECVNKDRPIVSDEERKLKSKQAKEKWLENVGSKLIECECGAIIHRREKPRHLKSKKHAKK